MIFFDSTKTGTGAPRSGLTRVSRRLREELGAAAKDVTWDEKTAAFQPAEIAANDWLLTSEVFSPAERSGFSEFLDRRSCRCAAIFHDAIPLKHPHITWPQSVARHPAYLKMLSRFDRIWAVSDASRAELLGYWQWAGVTRPPPVEVLALGADFNGQSRVTSRNGSTTAGSALPQLLCLGILEPRKNQLFLLEVCEGLWNGGMEFELHLVGRVNPHFGGPIVSRLRELRRRFGRWLHHHESATDAAVTRRYAAARATVLPTLAEGCGLPLLESLWMGVPVVCSDIAPVQENARDGGCVVVPVNDHAAWTTALREVLTSDPAHRTLVAAAQSRSLPTWSSAAAALRQALA